MRYNRKKLKWTVVFHDVFEVEFQALAESVQDSMLVSLQLLQEFGPQLGRPYVDTLVGSKHSNMKELRFEAEKGVWRVAFAFDSKRQAVLLVVGDKSGTRQKRFYKGLIKRADRRLNDWLAGQEGD